MKVLRPEANVAPVIKTMKMRAHELLPGPMTMPAWRTQRRRNGLKDLEETIQGLELA